MPSRGRRAAAVTLGILAAAVAALPVLLDGERPPGMNRISFAKAGRPPGTIARVRPRFLRPHCP